jgi:hypothetical protein
MTPVLRNFISPQIAHFRKTDGCTNCQMCRKPLPAKYHVDHENHFKQLEYLYNQSFGAREDDDEYRYIAGFIDFHSRHARLRKTCPDCNLRRPKWKPGAETCAMCNNVEVLSADGSCYPCESKM